MSETKLIEECESTDGPKCPYCGHEHCKAEDWKDVVTYWGDSTTDYQCSKCGFEWCPL